ncbi:MAG: hypothetical protein RIF41_32735 [Polyangiaceae bacterium]
MSRNRFLCFVAFMMASHRFAASSAIPNRGTRLIFPFFGGAWPGPP